MPRTLPPAGYVDTAEAMRITGVSRTTLQAAAQADEIPDTIQRKPGSPWFFTVRGLRLWMGVPADAAVNA